MTGALTALGQALRRQQSALTALLAGAGVPPREAEGLLLGVLLSESAAWWEQKPDLDRELRLRVAAACRRYADKKAGAGKRQTAGAPSSPGLARPLQRKNRR